MQSIPDDRYLHRRAFGVLHEVVSNVDPIDDGNRASLACVLAAPALGSRDWATVALDVSFELLLDAVIDSQVRVKGSL